MVRRNFTLDDTLHWMKDAGAIAVSAAAQVASVARIIDCGLGLLEGNIVIDVTALEIADNDEIYDIVIQLSTEDDFATPALTKDQWGLTLCASEVKRSDSDVDDEIGRYIMPFSNERMGTIYQYARLYTVVAGAVATGIDYTARLCK